MTSPTKQDANEQRRERHIKAVLRMAGIKIKHSLMEGWLRETWNKGYASAAQDGLKERTK